MYVTRLKLKNWRNFKSADVVLRERQFLVGANASGKSNFLDVFRFLRDVAKPAGGGLQRALETRGGITKMRSLAARVDPEVHIEIHLADAAEQEAQWSYSVGVKQETRGQRRALVTNERVWNKEHGVLFNRPNDVDSKDPERLTQTFLEQINENVGFREVATFLQRITYLHVVPQLLKFADEIQGRVVEHDPFGQGLLDRIARTPEKTRTSRLKTIEEGLKIAVPQFSALQFVRDPETGRPHLQVKYEHWRPGAGLQREDQFSDGTLRLIGLLWALIEGDSLLLLEEPELSLNAGIVSRLAPLIHRMQRRRKRQVFTSTHSDALLQDPGIDGREVVVLLPSKEGSEARVAADVKDMRTLLESGLSVAEAVLPRVRPPSSAGQLDLLE